MDPPEDGHYNFVVERMLRAKVIPFLGAGVNLAERPDGAVWQPGEGLPNARELAAHLAAYLERMWAKLDENPTDLAKVSQYVAAQLGEDELYQQLRDLFARGYRPNGVHRLLARVSSIVRARGGPCQLVVTTNYDFALEQAFEERDPPEPYDLLWYEAKPGEHCGKFFHRTAEGEVLPVADAASHEVEQDRTVILKIHGAVSRDDPRADSYVITENDYIAYLARGDIANELPPLLRQRLASSSFLFLGYGLSDWNLRVILSRLWGERELTAKSWAIQRYEPGKERLYEIERKLWDDRGEIEPHYVSLADYARSLEALLEQAAPAGAA